MLKDRSFFIYLPTSVVFYCFAYNHPSGCEVVSHFGFDLCFPEASNVEHLSMWLLTICVSSLEKPLFGSIFHFKLGYLAFKIITYL